MLFNLSLFLKMFFFNLKDINKNKITQNHVSNMLKLHFKPGLLLDLVIVGSILVFIIILLKLRLYINRIFDSLNELTWWFFAAIAYRLCINVIIEDPTSDTSLQPYQPEHAQFGLISQAKHDHAWLFLGWETARVP